jgi:hypothetical protein
LTHAIFIYRQAIHFKVKADFKVKAVLASPVIRHRSDPRPTAWTAEQGRQPQIAPI